MDIDGIFLFFSTTVIFNFDHVSFSFENWHNSANYALHDVTCIHISHKFLILYAQVTRILCSL